jgi:1-deoxy-D-xylulose-5-phosphate synthase
MEESLKSLMVPGMLFEDLGFRYLGPLDGHSLKELITVLERLKGMKGPILLHVLTTKGKGLSKAEGDPVKYHGVKPVAPAVAPESGKVKAAPGSPAYTDAFSKIMLRLADDFPEMVAVTAAMSEGTGLAAFSEAHPGRFFDVGIAEAHAVCFSAGLAIEGLRPVAAIYSSFLQRAYDQIIHDVAVQNLPVVFALDRAGVVGEDGPTHHGTFDLSYLGCVPGMIVSAPRDGKELGDLLYTALRQKEHPFAVRYPRAAIPPDRLPAGDFEEIPIGSWEILREGRDVCILAIGTMVWNSRQACDILAGSDIHPTVVNARFLNPMDEEVLGLLLSKHPRIVTVEENALEGGFGAKVARWAHDSLGTTEHHWLHLGIPPRFVEHASRRRQLELMGLDPRGIASRILASIHMSKPLVRG